MEDISPSDSLIFIMGVTGSGKSSFIADLLPPEPSDPSNETTRGVQHDLASSTAAISFSAVDITLPHRHGKSANMRVFLVDTPGFDDTYRSDAAILAEIAFILSQTHRAGLRLAGIVYLHRITDRRLQGSVARNLRILERLVGQRAFPAVVLATSMWDDVAALLPNSDDRRASAASAVAAAEDRERQLVESEHGCAALVAGGARVMRWTRGDGRSAAAIVGELVDRRAAEPAACEADDHDGGRDGHAVKLRIHEEMVDEGKELCDTEAGRLVATGLRTHLRDEVSEFRGTVKEEIKELRVGLRGLVEERRRAYGRTLSRVAEEEGRNQGELVSLQRSEERLAREEQVNDEALVRLQEELMTGTGSAHALSEEDRDELQSQFDEQQQENRKKQKEVHKRLRRMKRKKLMKKNIVPLLQILAGVGMIAAGGATMNPVLMIPGAGAIVGGITTLRSIKDKKTDEPAAETTTMQDQMSYSLIDLD